MNYQTQPARKNNRNKKKLAILLCLLMAAVLGIGSIFAFFSDIFSGNESITAGTLELDGSIKFYINVKVEDIDGDTPVATTEELACLNPGDFVVVVAAVENIGSKSAWLKNEVVLSGTDGEGQALTATQFSSVFTVEDSLGNTLTGANGTNEIVFADDGDAIIDGTYEEETSTGAIGDTAKSMTFIIYFDEDAGNIWQGASISIVYNAKAIQYRNNASPNWDNAVALNA